MKTVRLFTVFSVIVLIFAWSCIAFAEQNSITLPKGTKVEKIGPWHFKFKLPNGQVVEVKNFNPRTGAISYVSLINPDLPGKPVAAGKHGVFKTRKKLTKREAVKLQPENYIMIDNDVTWLPATISYQPVAISDPDSSPRAIEKGKIKELSPQPDPQPTSKKGDPCAKYYGRGYCTDYIKEKVGYKPSGDANVWPSNTPIASIRVGDAAIFLVGSSGHVAYVEEVIRDPKTGKPLKIRISEMNWGPVLSGQENQRCVITSNFGKVGTRTVSINSVAKVWRP